MVKTFSIERARAGDLRDILAVMETANMHHVPSAEMPELDLGCFFVAKAGGRVVGAAGYKVISSGEAKTTLMAVLPECRGMGIGKALQEARMLELARKGVRTLRTNADVPETIEWYKRHFGYRETGKVRKVHEFGRPDIDEWTSLETDLEDWLGSYERQKR